MAKNLDLKSDRARGFGRTCGKVPTVDSSTTLNKEEVAKLLRLDSELSQIGAFEHILSHRIISFTVFSCKMICDSRFTWLKSEDLAELPLASAQRKVLAVHYAP